MEERSTYLAKWAAGEISDEALKQMVGEKHFLQYKDILGVSSTWTIPSRYHLHLEVFKDKMSAKKAIPFKVYRFAAVLLVGLIATLFYWSQVSVVTSTQSQTVSIYDGTNIELAPASELSYNKIAYWFNREVQFKGNGYFEVIPGNEFTVNNSKVKVRVLGTKFRIIDRLNYYKVSCYTGKVMVDNGDQNWLIESNESIDSYSKAVSNSRLSSNDSDYLSYDSTPLYVVLDELSKVYGVGISADSVAINELFTGKIDKEDDLDTALKAVLYPFNYDYEKKSINLILIHSQY